MTFWTPPNYACYKRFDLKTTRNYPSLPLPLNLNLNYENLLFSTAKVLLFFYLTKFF